MVQERPAAHQPPSPTYSPVQQIQVQTSLGPAPCQPRGALQAALRWGGDRDQAHGRCICGQGVAPAQLEAAPLAGVRPGEGTEEAAAGLSWELVQVGEADTVQGRLAALGMDAENHSERT